MKQENALGYLVLGPESSGTRVTAELLVAAGCRRTNIVGGDDGPELPLEGHRPVIRRSAPHWRPPAGPHEWPDLAALAGLLAPRRVCAVVTTRDWYAMASSQMRQGHVRTLEDAHANIRRAYEVVFTGLAKENLPFVLSSYESLVAEREYRKLLLAFLGLPDADIETYDGNSKWYSR